MSTALKVVQAIASIILLVLLISTCVTWWNLSQDRRSAIWASVVGGTPPAADNGWSSDAGAELTRASADHYDIAYWISKCFKDVDISLNNDLVPGRYQVDLLLGMMPDGSLNWNNNKQVTASVPITSYQRALLYISQSVSQARAQFAASAASNRVQMFYLQCIIIALGALTTIFVSIKSSSSSTSKVFASIGILAIICSAASTAASSLNSFTSPSDQYYRSVRSLAQLRQLHLDLGMQVQEDDKLCDTAPLDLTNTNDFRAKRLVDFGNRLKELVVVGSSETANAGNGGTGGANSTPAVPKVP